MSSLRQLKSSPGPAVKVIVPDVAVDEFCALQGISVLLVANVPLTPVSNNNAFLPVYFKTGAPILFVLIGISPLPSLSLVTSVSE